MKFGTIEIDLSGLALVIAAIASAVKGIVQAKRTKRKKKDADNESI